MLHVKRYHSKGCSISCEACSGSVPMRWNSQVAGTKKMAADAKKTDLYPSRAFREVVEPGPAQPLARAWPSVHGPRPAALPPLVLSRAGDRPDSVPDAWPDRVRWRDTSA